MAYKKDHGRYARMASFWALFLLLGYGCLGGLVITLRGWFGAGEPWTEIPVLGAVDGPKIIALIALAVLGFLLHWALNTPKIADLLIETEAELRKVTWPSAHETWTGSVAVALTVLVMLFYLAGADLVLTALMPRLMGGGGAG